MVFNGWSRSIVPSGDWIVTGRKTYSCFQRSFRPYLYTVYTYSDGKRGLIGSPGSESSPGVQSARRRWSEVQMKPMLERLVEEGTIANYADAARQLGVTRARITQLINLPCLHASSRRSSSATCTSASQRLRSWWGGRSGKGSVLWSPRAAGKVFIGSGTPARVVNPPPTVWPKPPSPPG